MSRHHRAQRWTSFNMKRRAQLEQLLPLPCITCGRPVHPDPPGWQGTTTWHVGHVQGAASGGRPTIGNTGPAHARCNLREGGRVGAAVTHQRRQQAKGFRQW